MKYYVTLVQNETTCACYAFDTKQLAMARFHHEMEYAYTAGITVLCCVMSEFGAIAAVEKHSAPAPTPESGEEE